MLSSVKLASSTFISFFSSEENTAKPLFIPIIFPLKSLGHFFPSPFFETITISSSIMGTE